MLQGAAIFFFACLSAIAENSAASAISHLSLEDLVSGNKNAMIVLEGIRDDTGTPVQSSGCVVDSNGIVLTTAHQVNGVSDITGQDWAGNRYPLDLLELDQDRELALLHTSTAFKSSVALGDASILKPGSPIASIASPRNLDFTVSTGIVSNPDRVYRGFPVIQAELDVEPGSSGGPVFDTSGLLVGLIVGVLEKEEWATVLVPINNAYPMLSRHGIATPLQESPPMEEILVPVPGISDRELKALQAFNRGTQSSQNDVKIANYTLAVTLLPEFYEAWFNLGLSAQSAHDTKRAVQAYEKASSLSKVRIEALRNLGLLQLELKNYDQAAQCFEMIARQFPTEARARNELGEAYRRKGDLESAVREFHEAVSLEPQNAKFHYNLALTHMEAGMIIQAQNAFKTYLELEPDSNNRTAIEKWISLTEDK